MKTKKHIHSLTQNSKRTPLTHPNSSLNSPIFQYNKRKEKLNINFKIIKNNGVTNKTIIYE